MKEKFIELDDLLADIRAHWQEMDGEIPGHPKVGLRINLDAIEILLSKAQIIARNARDE